MEELQRASDEFGGHCFALTLLGSYLTDAYNGDVRCRKEVSARLAHDLRQGAHARKVMESYQSWLGEGPELAVLRMLGLFDRPADEKALGALLKSPAIPGRTESFTDLSPTAWRTILANLRRATKSLRLHKQGNHKSNAGCAATDATGVNYDLTCYFRWKHIDCMEPCEFLDIVVRRPTGRDDRSILRKSKAEWCRVYLDGDPFGIFG